jgi:hypothetical protein
LAAFQLPTFEQLLIMGNVQYQSEGGTMIGVSVVRGRDDASSLQTKLPQSPTMQNIRPVAAKDNLVASLNFSLPLFAKTLTIGGELAASRNGTLWVNLPQESCGFGAELPSTSAKNLRLDYAGRFNVRYAQPESPVSVQLRAEYCGPGYSTMGFPQLVNDRMEGDIATQLQLWEGKVTIGGSLGYMTDNLVGDRETSASRLIGSANLTAQISDELGMDMQFQNYGIRVAPLPNFSIVQPVTPILQSQQAFNTISLTPRGTFSIEGYIQNITLTASYQQFADINPETRGQTENTSQVLRLLWATTIDKLALTLNAGYTGNQSSFAQFQSTDVALTASQPIFDNKLTPTLTLSWAKTSESSGLDSRLSSTLRANYRLNKQLDAVIAAQANYYAYKPGSRSPSYSEVQISVELRQRF